MSALSSLIARLEKAEGPERLTDANILWAIDPTEFHIDAGDDQDHLKPSYCYARGGWTMNKADRLHLEMVGVPRFTSSIDAAVSLAERVLPGARWELTTTGFKPGASLVTDGGIFGGYAATPALAICLSALRALDQKGSSNG